MKLKYFAAKLIDLMFVYVLCSYIPMIYALCCVITYIVITAVAKSSIGDYIVGIKHKFNILLEPSFYFSISLFVGYNNIYINMMFVMLMIFSFIVGSKNIIKEDNE